MVFIIITVLCLPSCRETLKRLFTMRWMWAMLALFLLALVGCLWSPAAWNERGLVLEKWSKLLTLPLLMVGFQHVKTRTWALKGFVLAMVITCVVAIVMNWTGMFQTLNRTPDSVFRNHIMTSIMMAFATYLCLWLFTNERRTTVEQIFEKNAAQTTPTSPLEHALSIPGKRRIMKKVFGENQTTWYGINGRFVYGLFCIILGYHVLFVNQSRTGYVFFVLLMIISIFQLLPKRKLHVTLMGFSLICIFIIYMSPTIQQRITSAIDDVRTYEQDKNTSVGYRIQFHHYARQLFLAHPLFGHGTGSFTYSFRTENPVPAWKEDSSHSGRLLEPHSEYWLVAAEFGIVGLMILAWFYGELCLLALRLNAMRPIAIIMLLIFALGNLSDSLLFYSGSGYFFLLFFALCFSETCIAEPLYP